ncbi:MAG: glycerate kinase, partial [Duncaniella sp.]|nr:glycerate kinase [Duncaniella sp.]
HQATYIIRDAIASRLPADDIVAIPVADGGEGTAEVIAFYLGLTRRSLDGCNAVGVPVAAEYFSDGQGVVALDAAAVLGLTLVAEADRDVMRATSAPLGRLLREIISREQPREIYLGIGGTATSDGGAGMLQALGATFGGVEGDVTPATLPSVTSVDMSTMPPLPAMHLLCDVDVPLIAGGDAPSAMTFAPQKGLLPGDAAALRAALSHWSELTGCNAPFSGAGGGLISGLMSKFQPEYGADAVLALAGVDALSPDIVITGEGCVDAQSVMGKITGRIAAYARGKGARVIAIGGMVKSSAALSDTFDAVYSTLSTPAATPALRLHLTALQVAAMLTLRQKEKIRGRCRD